MIVEIEKASTDLKKAKAMPQTKPECVIGSCSTEL
jgi:hypothetical protein